MTIRRPALPDSAAPRTDPADGPGSLLLLAIAVLFAILVALIVPGRGDGHPDDAAAEGIAVAARCDAALQGRDGTGRWADCIGRALRHVPADPVAVAGLHFHAWRIADAAVVSGASHARTLRDTHLRALSVALDRNLLSLHRLCAAAAIDCRPIADSLARQV